MDKVLRTVNAGFIEWKDVQKVAKTLEADYVVREVTTFDQLLR